MSFKEQFARLIRESPTIEQWLTYPKCPKMNAHIERFNRTLQEDCINHAEDLLFADTQAFNDRLWGYVAWYNLHRPHAGNEQQAPIRMLLPNASLEALQKSHSERHRTNITLIRLFMIYYTELRGSNAEIRE